AAVSGSSVFLADRAGNLLSDRRGIVKLTRGVGATSLAPGPAGSVLLGRGDTVGWSNGHPVLVRAGGRVLGLSTGGGRFLVRLPGSVRVYTDDGSLVSTIQTTAQHAVLSPGGLGVATTKGTIAQPRDASTGRPLHTPQGHTQLVNDAQYSPNGRELVTVSSDHTGRIWDTRSGRLRRVPVRHVLPVNTGGFSP